MIPVATVVDVRTSLRKAIVEIQHLREDVKDRATFRALNRALDKVATETSREIRKTYNVKRRAIVSTLRKWRAQSNHHTARLVVQGVRLGLIEFDARWSRRMPGTSVKIKVAGGRKTIKGSFIATNPATGYRGVWVRTGKFGRRGNPKLEHIRNLRSISVPQAFSNRAVQAALVRFAQETFDKNFAQQVRFLNGGVAGGS